MIKIVLFYLIFLIKSLVFPLSSPENIIISENETVILDLYDYPINGNYPYTIINDNSENFNIRLTDTFSPLKSIDFFAKIKPNSLKFIEILHIYMLLFHDHLEIVDLESESIIPQFLDFLPVNMKNMTIKCFDFETFIDNLRVLMVDCNLINIIDKIKNITLIHEVLMFFELSIENNSTKLLNYQILSNFIDIFQNNYLTQYPRKLKLSKFNNELYRFTPFSQINNSNLTNCLEIYSISIETFSINLILILPQQNLEDIDFYNENPLLLDLKSGLRVLNGSLKKMKSVSSSMFFPLNEKILRVSYLEIEHSNNRVIVLTDRICFYLKLIKETLTFSYNYQLNIENIIDFQNVKVLQLPDYLLINYPDKLKVLYIAENLDPNDPKESIQFDYIIPENSNDFSSISITCDGDCDSPDSFSLFILDNANSSHLELIEITQRKLLITAMNTSNKPIEFYSMKRFNFTLTIKDFDDMQFIIIYWKFEDENLYFFSDNYDNYYNNHNNFQDFSRSLYIIDTEQIFILNRDFLLGSLKEVIMANKKPIKSSNLLIDSSSSYKLNIQGFNFKFLQNRMAYFMIVATPKSIRLLYQTKTDNSFNMASCLWNVGQEINECVFMKFPEVQKILRKSIRYKAFLLFQVEDEEFIYYSIPSWNNESVLIKKINDIICKDIDVEVEMDVFICRNNDETRIFLELYDAFIDFQDEEQIKVRKYVGKNIVSDDIQMKIKTYVELMQFRCLLVLKGKKLEFYEVIIGINAFNNKTAILKKRSDFNFNENHDFSFLLFSKTAIQMNFLIIYPKINEIL